MSEKRELSIQKLKPNRRGKIVVVIDNKTRRKTVKSWATFVKNLEEAYRITAKYRKQDIYTQILSIYEEHESTAIYHRIYKNGVISDNGRARHYSFNCFIDADCDYKGRWDIDINIKISEISGIIEGKDKTLYQHKRKYHLNSGRKAIDLLKKLYREYRLKYLKLIEKEKNIHRKRSKRRGRE